MRLTVGRVPNTMKGDVMTSLERIAALTVLRSRRRRLDRKMAKAQVSIWRLRRELKLRQGETNG